MSKEDCRLILYSKRDACIVCLPVTELKAVRKYRLDNSWKRTEMIGEAVVQLTADVTVSYGLEDNA
jgi:hypothetical protein